MSRQLDDLEAVIKPCPGGWKWTVTGDDVPYDFKESRNRYYPSGETWTRWGARREAGRKMKAIRRYLTTEPEVIR